MNEQAKRAAMEKLNEEVLRMNTEIHTNSNRLSNIDTWNKESENINNLHDALSKINKETTKALTQLSSIEIEKEIANSINRERGKLTGYDCSECLNRGYFLRVDEIGRKYSEECKCMRVRRSLENIERSGLKDMMERYNFETWRTDEEWQENAARRACEYVRGSGEWFYIGGTVGAGKTHLCTAICGAMLKRGVAVRYVLWRDIATQAKSCVNDEEEYNRIVSPLKRAKNLYIDDLFKCGKGQEPTTADVNLAFEVLNARYNDSSLRTIISSELTLDKIIQIDSAVGSRIYERAKEFYIPLEGKMNWRLKID